MGQPKNPGTGTSKASKARRDELFIKAYFALGENGTQAVLQIKPHLKPASAAVEAHHLLKQPKIQEAIEKHRTRVRAAFSLTVDRVAQEWARVGYFNAKKMVDEKGRAIPLHLLDDDTAAGLASVDITEVTVTGKGKNQVVTTRTVKGRPFNKNAALAAASKILRLYDKPPPPPADPNALDDIGRLERARRIAFAMVQGARLAKAAPVPAKKPAAPTKKRSPTTA